MRRVNPMISPRYVAMLGVALMTLPTLVPGVVATADLPEDHGGALETAFGGCTVTYTDWMNSGSITVTKRGTYYPEGYATDGCKGNGCDDSVWGYFWNGVNAYREFELYEVRTSAGCRVSCWVETSAGIWSRHAVEGKLYVDTYENLAHFRCGTEGTSSFLFKGNMIWCSRCYAGIDPDAGLPAIETGDLTI